MTRGRGFSSYRGSSGTRMSWNDGPGGAYGSSHNMSRISSFVSSLDSRSRYPHPDRYGGSGRSPYDDYHKSYRSDLSSSYSGRDHRSPERKRLREEAPRSRREIDSFSSSRYASSFMDRNMRDRRPPPPPTISRRDDFRRPLPPPSSPRGGYRGRLSSRGIRGIRLRDGPPRRRLAESSYGIRRRLPPLLSSDYTRRLKVSRLRSAIARRAAIKRRQVSKDDSDDEKKSEDGKEKKDKDQKGDSDAEDKEEKTTDSKKKESDKEKGEEGDKGERSTKRFIKLVCPHCNSKYITFGKYSAHLHSSRHVLAMRQIATKQKGVLARMRLSQRNAQRELEKNGEDLAPRTNFCTLCKLNYKQPKITHQASDAHKNMKKFLMPYCKVCRVTFKNPMTYETHICSIDHLKRKARNEINGDKSDNDSEDLLEHFMTLDSVGGEDDASEGKKKDKPDSEGKKIPVNVGIEQIKKVEVHYCDLCRMYLPRVEEAELEKTLTTHCKQRIHLQRYIRYKEDKEIASRAEKLQRKETAEKEREKKDKEDTKNGEENKVDDSKEDIEEKDKVDEDETMDDKLWADDVNKDLGDILAEAESGNKSSDDEGGERFDRFGTSEKNGDEIEKKEPAEDTSESVVENAISQ